MEKERKSLKELSILVLVFVGLSLIRMVVDVVINGFTSTPLIKGLTQDAANIIFIVSFIISLLFLIPEIYVGYKGIKISQKPNNSKSHIIFAKVIFVLIIISLVGTILELVKGANLAINIFTLADILIDAVLYYLYIKYANKIRKQHQE